VSNRSDRNEILHLKQELETTRQDLRDAVQAKSQFLANMSHELRTPLNGIMGMLQILMGSDLRSDQREFVSLSLDASRQLNKALSDLLTLSSIEDGSTTPFHTTFSLEQTLDSLITPLIRQATEKSVTLTLKADPNLPHLIHGDLGKLRQILFNLLGNAIKFTEQGTVSLHVERVSDTRNTNGVTLAFSVIDTGIGIQPEMQAAIFDNFTLGEDFLTKQYGGTGLGLSIARQLADIMGGSIEMESTPKQGSTFRFTAPFDIIEDKPQASTITPTHDTLNSLNILLAEDEQVNSIMASRLLKKAGHDVIVVGNGQQAIDALTRNRFDLVLMDIQMPVVNGLMATKIIRSGGVEGVSRDLPIIGLTAFARSSEKQSFINAGMQRIVTKPFEPEELARAINETMTQQ